MNEINVSHHYLDVDGIKWHWVEQGEGTPIVLLTEFQRVGSVGNIKSQVYQNNFA